MPIEGLTRDGTAPARKQRLIGRCIGAKCASRPPCDPFMAHRLKDQASRARRSRAPRSAPSKAFFSRGSGPARNRAAGAIGHKSACPSGHLRFATCFDLKTPGGRGISIILGVYIKALCRHPQRPACLRYRFGRQVRAEGVRCMTLKAATGYRLCLQVRSGFQVRRPRRKNSIYWDFIIMYSHI